MNTTAPTPAKRGADYFGMPYARLLKRRGSDAQPPELDTSHRTVLYLEDITVSFDGFKALNALTLYIDVGELRCIIGPNGAGKTTMMDVITGKTRPDHGSAWFGQTLDLLAMSEPEIVQAGIGRKFQRPTVFQNHTVFENLELAMAGDKRVWTILFAKLGALQRERIEKVLETVGLKDQRALLAGSLSHGQKQWLEIGMLLAQDPKLLLVDEPVAGMTDVETHQTAELLKEINKDKTVMVVEHDMTFVRELGVKVTCLHEGTVLAEGTIDQVSSNERVVEVYLGR